MPTWPRPRKLLRLLGWTDGAPVRAAHARVRMQLEEIEPRILHSADLLPGLPPGALVAPVEIRLIESPASDAQASSIAQQTQTRELLFVDATLGGYQTLVDELLGSAGAGRQIDLIVLDGNRDGVAQVATALESAAGAVSAVHFVTHGTEGAIKLGSTWLRVADLGTHEAGLVAWRGGLEAGADLYFYGCNVADTADGRALIEALHELTGADVAASDDVTGAAWAGGNWVLEYTSGLVSATGVLALGPEASWSGVLASLTVSTTNDVVDGDTSSIAALLASRGADGAISLREAIVAANNTAGTDSIIIPDGVYILTRVGADDTALLGDLDILGSVDLLGTSVAGTIIDGNASDRVFHLLSSSTVTASDLTVRNASTTQGGAFQVIAGSSLTLTRVVASGNTANTLGGAVQNSGTLNMTDVRLTANNVFNNQGGGFQNAGTATLNRVTIDANNAKFGGGIVNSGTLTLTNVTLSGNVANGTQMNGKGGAIYNSGTLSATNVTITGNTTALNGGGLFMNGGSATFKNTIVAGNTAGLTGPDVEGAITSAGNNLVGNSSSSSGWVGSDRVNVASGLNATLAFNGGLVPTHALLAGSVAINGGTATGAPAVDARNVARDGTPDIGAYELASNTPPAFTSAAAASAAENQTIAHALTASDADGDGVSFTLVGGADAARFVVDGANRLVFASAPNYESPADANADNVYEVQVRVADGRGGSADQSLTVTVYNVNEAPSGSGATVTTAEDTPYTFTIANFGFGDAADAGAHALAAVRITTLPVTGVLRRNGVDVSAGDFVSAADIAAGLLVYTPPADDNGTAYASFTFQVRDDGGTANGGIDLDPTPRTMTIDVTAVNDAPVNATPGGQSTATNTPLVFSSGNGNAVTVSDKDAGGGALEVNLAVTQGVLTLSGSAGLTFSVGTGTGESTMTFSGSAAAINAALNGLRYDPTVAYSGPAQLSITTNDLGNTGSGGVKSASSAVAIAVSYSNSAPVLSGAAALGSISEDAYGNSGMLVSALIAGRVTDADAGALSGIAVTAVDNADGAWQYSTDARATWTSFGTPSTSAARLLAADSSTYVRFVPNLDWNGTVVNGITFRAWDATTGATGATADTSSGGFSVRDNFAAVSYANQDGTASWAGDWVDSDGAGAGGGQIQVSGGALVMNAGIVSSNTIYRQANLSAATDVTFSFSYNNSLAGLASVSVSVSGDGGSSWTTLASGFAGGAGTASYGISGEAAANTRIRFGVSGVVGGGSFSVDDVQIAYTQPLNGGTTAFSAALESSAITVSAINDAPAGTSATVTTGEDTPYAFTVANFGFSDPVEGHGLLAVKIATLPAAGALTLNGSAVTAGQFVSAADITAGLLAFTPSANASGAGYATFGFQVQDNGGTVGGGVDLDPVSRTMTVDVTAVNDAPTGTSSTVTTDEDVAYVFAASSFGFDDAADGHGLMAVKIASLPAAGALTLNGAAISAGDFVSAADIVAGRLVFTPGANAVGAGHASFTFQVQDNGGTANGGIDLDTTARTLTIDVTAVNDAPSGTSATVTTGEDTAFTFTAAHFGFTDTADTPANALAAVKISSVPVAGTLSLSGVAVTAGQFVSAADITAGALVYAPAENGNGTAYASFTFQVRDDGGTANDGIDLDPTARTMTIDVTAVNDAPSSTVPVTQTTSVSTPLVFSSAIGNAISVSDVDAGTSQVQVALTVTNGTLTLGGTTGLTFSVGNGSANTSMTFTGTLANVNAGLDGLRYIPTTLYVGTAQVSITTSDLGNTGAGGALTAVDYVAISVGEQAMVDQIQSSYEAPFVDLSDYELKSGQSWGQTFVYDSPGATYAVDKVALVLSRSVDATAGQTLTVSLRSSWGGAALATATLSSDALGTSESWVTLALNTPVSLNDNQTYYLRVDSNGSGKVWLGVHNGGSYASGDLINHPGVAQGGKDAAFRIIDNRPTTAPVLSGANAVTGIAEDPASNPGTAVSVLIAGRVTDGDTGALSGIAVTAVDDTNGTWQYSLDGTSWSSFGTPSAASARLLASDDWVRFVPNANWHGTVASGLTFRSWDQTTGTAGTAADTTTVSLAVRDNFGLATYSGNDGTASWSSSWLETGDNASPASGQIRVTGGRLRFDGGLSTTSTIERQVNLANATSATLTFDFDNSIGTGTIRLFASSNGGTSWTQLAGSFAGGTGSASYNLTGYASADTRVRFQVIGEPGVLGLILQGGMFYADNVQISYVMPLNGGNTAFSVASASSGLTVASANDAPVGVSNTVTTVEDTSFTFTAAHFGFSDPVDVPANAFAGVRVVTLPGAGTLRLNGVAVSAGASVTAADIAANRLVYTPGADGNGTGYASFTFQVRDDGGTANGGVEYDVVARTLTIDVTAVNDAPVLTGANALTAIAEDAASNGGTSIAALLATFTSDADASALSGIAVTAVDDTNGTWQYSTNSGGVWTSFGTPSAGTARLLAADGSTLVRFVPNADWNGTVANGITFHAWDRTSGANGATASTAVNGGATAFSTATASASITVTPVNDAPVLSGANSLTGINEDPATNGGTLVSALISGRTSDVDAGAVSGIAVIAVDNTNGTWQYSLDGGGAWSAFGAPSAGNARLLLADANTLVRFVPNANWNGTVANGITFRAWDGTQGINGGTRATIPLVTYADNFSTESYARNDGTATWAGPWIDTADASAANGDFHVTSGGLLHIHPDVAGIALYRQADLSGAVTATLSFIYDNEVGGSGSILLQMSADAGATYSTIATFANGVNDGSGTFSADVSAFVSSATRLRFLVTATGGGKLDVDTLALTVTAPGNGGTTAFSTASVTRGITVTPVNDAPVGANNTVTATEDTTGTFTRAMFGYSDAGDSPVNAFAAVRIVTLPGAGTLTLDGVAVTAGQTVAIADIDAGKLAFRAAADANGTGYTSFTFRVQDDGGTANGGIDLDPTARTMTINVTAVNDAPVLAGANALSAITEDTASNAGTLVTALIAGQFSDADAGALEGIAVTAVDNANGTWQYSLNGSTWSNFGAPSAGNARLLWADADNRVRFVPDSNWNGTAGITFRGWDRTTGFSGTTADATANGGSTAYSAATATAYITVNAVNDAPAGANRTIATSEDTPYVLAAADFGYSDAIDGHALAAVKIAALPAGGTLRLSNVALTAGQFVSAADIAAGNLVYTPGAHASGTGYASFTFQVQDAGGTANGGIDLDSTPNTITIDVTAVNDAPTGTSATLTLLEDATRVLTAADFGYADAVEGHAFVAVKISTVPVAGALTLNGSSVAAGQFVSAADIAAGRLAYAPAANSSGAGYASFTFQVQDGGGTANGGIDLDPVARTITLDVTAVNDAPSGADATLTLAEDTTVVLTAAHFGYTDAADGDALLAVNIVSAPGAGVLRLSGVTVADGQAISAADIAAGNLVYTPGANAHGAAHASFTFQVQDAGGKANGGLDLDPVARTLTFDVTSINDAPSASDVSVGTPESVPLVFTIANFGLVDAADQPGNSLAAVRVATLPVPGALTLNGVVVTPGQWVSAAEISSGLLVYTPVAGTSGLAYASFGFQVRDDGGTAGGGIDTDPTTRTLTIDVGAINHGPVGTSTTLTLLEDGAHVFAAADFGYTDPNDPVANAFAAVKIATLPGAGTLTLNGSAVSAGQFVSIADLAAGRLVYSPAAHASGTGYASFAFQVQDDGGTANGGSDLDPIARTMTLNVTAVSDAPSGADRTLTLWEDQAYAFGLTDFGFSDALDTPANGLIAVRLVSLPDAGALTLNGAAVSAGQSISAADVAAGRLVFTAAADGNGAGYASFTFRVQDGGGTANGGVDLDPTARTLTLNVTAVNDAPSIAGANALDAIMEDVVSNTGTRVSALIAGHVFDADAATAFGIAVVGVDDTNGTWQYSTNAGASWTAFGVPSAGSARLLGADANTFVRFVPNPDFHGAVTNGLTFRAWDGSMGSAGGLADATRGTTAVRDDFSSASYGGNAGASIWLGPWTDPDRNPGTGAVQVVAGALRIATFNGTTWVYRDVDLAAATGAQLSFAYNNALGAAGSVLLQVSANGGTSYDTVDSFSDTSNGGVGVYSLDLASYLTSDTRLRFVMQGNANGGTFFVDNVEIQYDAPLAGGAGAFSSAVVNSGITVLALNDAPSGADATLTLAEDTPVVLTAAHFGYTDAADGDALLAVNIVSAPGAGVLRLSGVTVAAGDAISVADIAAGNLVYTPATNAHGVGHASFTFRVQDAGGTANGGIDLDPLARTLTFDVTAVNDAPSASDVSVGTFENMPLVLEIANFGFADVADQPGNGLSAVRVATLPAMGTLTLNSIAVTAGQWVSAADISSGLLVYTPVAGTSGLANASFGFQVRDDGGTAGGGIDTDPATHTLTIDVGAVNHGPVGTSTTLTLLEDGAHVFAAADFGYTDPNDPVAHAFTAVKIATLPAAGTLTLNGAAVSAGQFVSVADLAAGRLVYSPPAHASGAGYASFAFQVQDDGGTANGGRDLDPLVRALTFDVTAVNDAPTGADGARVILEDTAHVFSAADFGYADAREGHAFAGVRIGGVPAAGTLTLNGAAVSAGELVSAGDVAAGRLVYAAAPNAHGAGYSSFTFQVRDDGGTAFGGADTDLVARTYTFDVTSVDDAPQGVDARVSTLQDTAIVFGSSMFGFSDPADSPGGALLAVKISALPVEGTLRVGGATVTAGQFISAAAIDSGLFSFTPASGASGASYATFLFQVQDDGVGVTVDPVARTMTIDVTAARREIVIPAAAPVVAPPVVAPAPVAEPRVASTPAAATPAAASSSSAASGTSAATAAAASPPAESTAGSGEGEGGAGSGESAASARARGAEDQTAQPATGDSRQAGGVSSAAAGAQAGAAMQRADSVQVLKADVRDATVVAPVDSQILAAVGGDGGSASSLLLAAQSQSSSNPFIEQLESRAVSQELDQMRDNLRDQTRLESATVAATAATSMSLSVGYVVWLLRGGALLSTVLSSLPAWRFIDPLPVLGRNEDDDEDDDDESLESMVAKGEGETAENTDGRTERETGAVQS